jgi:hypothetical protein
MALRLRRGNEQAAGAPSRAPTPDGSSLTSSRPTFLCASNSRQQKERVKRVYFFECGIASIVANARPIETGIFGREGTGRRRSTVLGCFRIVL